MDILSADENLAILSSVLHPQIMGNLIEIYNWDRTANLSNQSVYG